MSKQSRKLDDDEIDLDKNSQMYFRFEGEEV